MKQTSIIIIALAFLSVGCKPKETVITGPNGEKVAISNNGSSYHAEATDSSGNKVTETVNGSNIEMKSSKGESFKMGTGDVTEDTLGLPFYPGSQEKQGGSMMSEDTKAKTVLSMRTTKDDPDQVAAFYKDKIDNANSSSGSGGNMKMSNLQGKLKGGADVSVSAIKNGTEDTTVSITVKTNKGS